jgi:hypothetical protein
MRSAGIDTRLPDITGLLLHNIVGDQAAEVIDRVPTQNPLHSRLAIGLASMPSGIAAPRIYASSPCIAARSKFSANTHFTPPLVPPRQQGGKTAALCIVISS